ncbi:phosphatidylinositol kinase- protein kinase tor1, partial [Coemansia nantahalensis]
MEARRAEELAGDQSVVNTKLKRWLASMVSSKDQQDQLAAIAVLSEMIEADSLEDNVMTRIVGQTRKLLQSSDEAVCGAALDIYRRLVQKRWTHVLQFAESDISWCLETLASGGSEARLLTMLQLTEIIGKEGLLSPNSSVPRVLALLSQPLRDSRVEIRIAAGRALGACLGVVPPSERNPHNPWLNLLYEELQRNQQAGSIESLHGSQLICQELLRNGGTYMEPRFAQACETATRLTGHRDTHVRRAAIEQLPVLARYSPQGFARTDAGGESTLSRSCRFLISLARSADPERHTAFVVLADIALACAADFAPLLGLTMGEIRGVLAQQARLHKKDAAADNPVTGGALKAISMLVTAMGPAIACHMHDTLDLMFAGGLNQALCHALRALVHNVDQLQPVVLARVVDMVSVILAGHPFRPAQHCLDDLEWRMGTMSMHYAVIAGNSPSDSATAKGVGHVPPATDPTAMVVQAASNIPVTTDTLVLALRTLREFDFSEENLAEFLRTVVLDYIVHSSAAVRSEAIQTAAHI